jgi:flagellin-like hook-associated protein FlgL
MHAVEKKLDLLLERIDALSEQFRQVRFELGALTKRSTTTMALLDDLQAKVAAETSVVASGITLMQGLSDKLKALQGLDPAAIAAEAASLSAQLDASTQAMAAAIAANTPAAPAPAPAPAEPPPAPAAPTTPAV